MSPIEDSDRPHFTPDPRRRRTTLAAVHFYVRITAVFAMVLIVGLAGGMLIERNIIAHPKQKASQFEDLQAVADIIEQDYYYRPTDATETATWDASLEQQAISGMLSSLDDKYTRYLSPPDARTESNQLAGTYEGVGISLGTTDTTVIVTAVTAGGPAEKAGILKGDEIIAVDGRNVHPGDDVAGMIQGPAGTQVKVEVQRGANPSSTMYTLTRAQIVTPPVSYRILSGTRIADIDIDIFGDQTTELVTTYLQQAQKDGATGVIIDLRGNGGGWVNSAQEVIGRFVPSSAGPALYEDSSSLAGGETAMPIDNGSTPLYTGPLVVLVDGNTASAAEIVAASLKDYDRALVVGQKTYGKGSVQRIYDFPDGSSIRVTVAEWLTPSKGKIQGVGVVPNVPVATGTAPVGGEDADVAEAVALLRAQQSRPSDLDKGAPATPVAATPEAPAVP